MALTGDKGVRVLCVLREGLKRKSKSDVRSNFKSELESNSRERLKREGLKREPKSDLKSMVFEECRRPSTLS